MAIPTKPLELTLDPKKLTLGDVALFEPDGFTARGLISFLVRYSNWTAAEVASITLEEFETLAPQIGESLKSTAVPKVSNAS